jgi:hypothetical protein
MVQGARASDRARTDYGCVTTTSTLSYTGVVALSLRPVVIQTLFWTW